MRINLNVIISYLFIIIMCINPFLRHGYEFNLDTATVLRGSFYYTLLFVIFGIISSKQFRNIFSIKDNIIVYAIIFIGLINGILNNNAFYYIKDDLYKFLLIFAGILASLILSKQQKGKYQSALPIIIFVYFIGILITLFKENFIFIGLGIRYDDPSVLEISFMLYPLFFLEMIRKKIIGQSNIKYIVLLLLLLIYESLLAIMRANILIIIIGIITYIYIKPTKTTYTLDVIKKILLFSVIVVGFYQFVFFLGGSYIDRSNSDKMRLFELFYVYENYISDNLIFGGGLGKVFYVPDSQALLTIPTGEVHLGFVTILLKFGLVGLITLFFFMLRYALIYLLFSNSEKLYKTKNILILIPSLFIWFFSLIVVKGTTPEHMFGLGLAIGSYIQFSKYIDVLNSRNIVI